MIFPDAWERFLAPIPEAERGDMIAAYYKRLTHADRSGPGARRRPPGASGRATPSRSAAPRRGRRSSTRSDFAIAFARIECHYFVNGGFFPEDGWLLDQVDKIRKIPTWIVQGRFDVVTPLDGAWKLHRGLARGEVRDRLGRRPRLDRARHHRRPGAGGRRGLREVGAGPAQGGSTSLALPKGRLFLPMLPFPAASSPEASAHARFPARSSGWTGWRASRCGRPPESSPPAAPHSSPSWSAARRRPEAR